MLFNSIEFLFFFLPTTFAGFFVLRRHGHGRAAMGLLALASLFFYGWWDIRYLALLLGSVIFNFAVGRKLLQNNAPKSLLIFGVFVNLIALGFFKYFNFFIDNLDLVLNEPLSVPEIILPLGISFFTFQQIAYLVDAYRKEIEDTDFLDYLVFVTFFPQLIAGPIVHHKAMLSQFAALPQGSYDWSKAALGITVFAIGLFKKVMLADEFASIASPLFVAAEQAENLSFAEGWSAALSYSLQLYFDFSGYSDMAIGLGLLFGVRLPTNFLSPYKASNIIDFWKSWHITLSQFLKDYLYIPLGGNRKGEVRRYLNLIITMLLGGLWHGAGWTYVIWGGLHGFYLMINHFWRKIIPPAPTPPPLIWRGFSWLLTMLAVVIAWVIFRSATLDGALTMLSAMVGQNGFDFTGLDNIGLIVTGFVLTLFLPNVSQIIAYAEKKTENQCWYSWKPDIKWISLTIILLLAAFYTIVYNSNRISEFIYFQF